MKILLSAMLVVALFAGCATTTAQLIPETAEAVASTTKVTTDPYTKHTLYEAEPLVLNGASYRLRYVTAADDAPSLGVLVDAEGPQWRFLETGHDSNGRTLEVSVLDRVVRGPHALMERMMVYLTVDDLRAYHDGGMSFRLDGQRGQIELVLPPYYVQGFLRAIERS